MKVEKNDEGVDTLEKKRKPKVEHVARASIGLDLDTSVVAESLWQQSPDSSLHANSHNLTI